MNIGIDARSLIKKKTGIGFYVENLILNLVKVDKENTYYLFSDRKVFLKDCEKYDNINIVEYSDGILLKKTFWYFFKLGKYLNENEIKLDVFWATQHIMPLALDDNIYKVITVLDFVYYEFPRTTTLYNLVLSWLLVPYSIKTSDKVLAISNSTKTGVIKYFGKTIKEYDVKVIYLGVEDIKKSFLKNGVTCKRLYSFDFIQEGNFLLYVGTIEPRKNLIVLLDAFTKIRRDINLKLVLCGKMGWKTEKFVKQMNNHLYKEDIFYFDYVSNEEKYYLMEKCFAFIFPSIYEGFGLPVIEAMKMNAVTLVSRSSSLDEIVELNELKFNATDSTELYTKVISLYNNEKLYNLMKLYCSGRSNDFKWQATANQYLEVFERNRE
ncbi:glycosyltransferase family 4 protein [Clostridium sp. DL1XJH146]